MSEDFASNGDMQWKRLLWLLPLTAALAVAVPARAQQKQQQQKQAQKQKKPKAPEPVAPFAPGSPSNINPPKPAGWKMKVTCAHGNCKAKGNPEYKKTGQGLGSLPPSPGAERKERKANPFPMAESKAAQQKEHKKEGSQGGAANANPFPMKKSEAAQAKQSKDRPPAENGVYSSSNQRMSGMNVLGNGAMVQPGTEKHPAYDPALATKDDKVGKFYLQTGDWAGAYGRYKQAAQVNPKDIKAVIGLAIAADHLGKRQVAIQNYKLYLDVMPDGKYSKKALKALKRLSHEMGKAVTKPEHKRRHRF